MSNEKILVVSPTLNEILNIEQHIASTLDTGCHMLIVDDDSIDGTSEIVKNHKVFNEKIFLLHRKNKRGLGTAYIDGFNWGLSNNYEYIVEMDADLSHRTEDLKIMIEVCQDYDLVIGSRYTSDGNTEGWSLFRELLSRNANFFSRMIMNSKVKDLTSGFRIYKSESLKKTKYNESTCEGYAFQIDMTIRAEKVGLSILEIPIIFVERESGSSKMNTKIILEAILYLLKRIFSLKD